MTPTEPSSKVSEIEVFLFPLPQVSLFPGSSKPLRIFEPRYLSMVNDAIERNRMIALVYADPAAAAAQEYGLLAHVRAVAGCGNPRIFEKRDDGTLLILLEGRHKIHLRSIVKSDTPYLIAKADIVVEPTTLESSHVFLLNRLMKALQAWVVAHISDANERAAFWDRVKTPEEKINTYCALVVRDPELRQSLLEADGIGDRLSLALLTLATGSHSH